MKRLVFILFVIASFGLWGQSKQSDSLNASQGVEENKREVTFLNTVSQKYIKIGKFDTALVRAVKAKELALLLGFKKELAHSYIIIANAYIGKQNYTLAIKNNADALKIYKETNDTDNVVFAKKNITFSYIKLGDFYYEKKHYSEAIKNYQIAINLGKQVSNNIYIAGAYDRIAMIYSDQKNILNQLIIIILP